MKPIRVLLIAPSLEIVGGQSVQAARLLDALRGEPDIEIEFQPINPRLPGVLRELTAAGYALVIASNQPAAAKGKTTRAVLDAVHAEIVRQAESAGGMILSSHICFHRSEDGCACRKPATGLLAEAFARHSACEPAASWMVGDRATDVLAGVAFGLRTAYLGDGDDLATLRARAVIPSFCGGDLRDFAAHLLGP